MTTISAPGKLMLFGEHAVVYGYPCIVTAVSERLFLTIKETHTETIEIQAPQVKDTRFVDRAIANTLSDLNIHHHGLWISTDNKFSTINGFGSSAAVTVSVIKALSTLFKKELSERQLFDIAYKTVIDVQGVGSGFDVAASTYGQTLLFRKAGQEITPLSADFSTTRFLVAYTGIKADTTSMVKEVAQKKEQYPEKIDRIFEAIGALVIQAKERMIENDWKSVGKLMDFNQEYLRDLGVSTERIEAMISAAKHAGALGAKLSGAGGGDCMISLVEKDQYQNVVKGIESVGGTIVPIYINESGVREEL